MAADTEDPRETALHPRHAESVVGHQSAIDRFLAAVSVGRPHHAWLITGHEGIGKATLAYWMARVLLNDGNTTLLSDNHASRLVDARSHPDLFILQRQLSDSKAIQLKTEISVENAREMSAFFSRTAAMAKWRVAIIDAADDLNTESANALLKLIEEPPPNCVILLVCNLPGRILKTIRSRCLHVALTALASTEVHTVFAQRRFLDFGQSLSEVIMRVSHGSPGRVLALQHSDVAKAMETFDKSDIRRPESRLNVVKAFSGRGPSADDFTLFVDLLLDWVATQAKAAFRNAKLASTYGDIQSLARRTEAYNLDRKIAILESLSLIDHALKDA
jgi:DNA polymerase III subunit delta'